jgi:ketosteroid isomerase-like protein
MISSTREKRVDPIRLLTTLIDRDLSTCTERHMQRHIRKRTLATFTLLITLCVPTFADDASTRAAIEAAAQAWTNAYNARDIDKMLDVATEGVVLMDPTLPPASGKAAAKEVLEQTMHTSQQQLTSTTKEIGISQDTAWRIATLGLKGTTTQMSSQVMEVWQRVGGEWKLHRQLSSGVLARGKLIRPRGSEPMLDTPRD